MVVDKLMNILDTTIKITVISNIVFEPYLAASIKQNFGERTTILCVPFGI